MTVLASQISPRSEAFQANRAYHRNALAELHGRLELVRQGGGEFQMKRHR